MNSQLNNKNRPRYYQIIINNDVAGICCLFQTSPPRGWTEIGEERYRYLSNKESLSKNIGAKK